MLALVLLAGSYFIMRSIDRERAVARLQSEFVSAVSHEFRTPLTSLRQLSEMLSKGRVPTEDLRQKSYDILSGESERLQRLVESLLDFGRIEARAFRYRFEPLDPATLVRDVVAEFQEKAAAQGYPVELELAGPSIRPIRADREALGLALRNLLDNAVKYSPDCRTVWVEMARERGPPGHPRPGPGHGHSGVGTEGDLQEDSSAGPAPGRPISKGPASAWPWPATSSKPIDGEIRLESEPGKGSTFTILLPLEKTA